MPGAFTPTCTDVHLPGFLTGEAELAAAGVEKVAVVTMNDAFVNAEWRKVVMGCANVESSKMEMFADGDGDAVTALGYVLSNSGLERMFSNF